MLTLASALRSSVIIVLCAGFESSTCEGVGGGGLLGLVTTGLGLTTSIPLPFGRWIVVKPLKMGNVRLSVHAPGKSSHIWFLRILTFFSGIERDIFH